MHAAFEVGVLTAVLERMEAKTEPQFELIGLSGTSAGALCALMVWYGLESNGGSPARAIEQLENFWKAFLAEPGAETWVNSLTYGALCLEETEIPWLGLYAPIFGLNPSGAFYKQFAQWLPRLGVRQQYFDLDKLLEAHCRHFDSIKQPTKTRLLIGATEIINGYETVFDSDATTSEVESWHQRLPLTLSGIAASGTLPRFREAQHIRGCYYWDGLYSQNPPIRDFVSDYSKAPDEIWILRINPQQRPHLPTKNGEIQDRENELMGNLSLHKDLDFILKVNTWRMRLTEKSKDHVFEVLGPNELIVRTIKMSEDLVNGLSFASKFDRSPACMRKLRDDGYERATEWLAKWPDVPKYPEDAGYPPRTEAGAENPARGLLGPMAVP